MASAPTGRSLEGDVREGSSVPQSPRSSSQPGEAWGLLPPPHAPAQSLPAALSSFLSLHIGVTKSDLHTDELRAGKSQQEPSLLSALVGFFRLSAPQLHSLQLLSGGGNVLSPEGEPKASVLCSAGVRNAVG